MEKKDFDPKALFQRVRKATELYFASPFDAPMDHEIVLQSELVDVFEAIRAPLEEKLVYMLREAVSYRFHPDTQDHYRGGSGFTSAGRYVADVLYKSHYDLRAAEYLFRETFVDACVGRYKESKSKRKRYFSISDYIDLAKAHELIERLPEGQRLLGRIIFDIVNPVKKEQFPGVPRLECLREVHRVGTCTDAEKFFVDCLRNKSSGAMNYVVDQSGAPLLAEKIGAGVEHASLTLCNLVLDGVRIPPGSLVYTKYPPDVKPRNSFLKREGIIPIDQCEGFHLLRLLTFAVSPKNREREFGMHLAVQKQQRMKGYKTITMRDFQFRAYQATGKMPPNASFEEKGPSVLNP